MFGHPKVQFESGEAEPADQSRDQQRGQHRRDNEKQQVIRGDHGGEAHHQDGQSKQQSPASDLIANAARQNAPELFPIFAHRRFDCATLPWRGHP